MDDSRFDDLAKVLTVPSRRGIVTAAATAALASLMAIVGRGGPDTTKAAKKKKKRSGAKSGRGPAGPPGPQGAQGPPGPVRIAFAEVSATPNSTPHRTSEGVSVLVVGAGDQRKYCFSLPFRPIVAVSSPHFNNSAVVATVTEPYAVSSGINCPQSHSDAAARTIAASGSTPPVDGTVTDQVHFRIIFL
jgi:hypothetical protein